MQIEDDGTIVYHLRGRQRIAAPVLTRALVPAVAPHGPSPLLAAVLSAVIPGAGHLYARRVAAAVLWFLVVSLGYFLIIPGLVLHLFSMVSAATTARHVESGRARFALGPVPSRL